MSQDTLTLVQHEGRLYVERQTTDWSEPLAVRMWWTVEYSIQSPSAMRCDPPVGQPLTSLPTGNISGDYEHAGSRHTFFLPQRGRTPADRVWHAAVPQPRPGDTWSDGAWVRSYARRCPRILPIAWDRLQWVDQGAVGKAVAR